MSDEFYASKTDCEDPIRVKSHAIDRILRSRPPAERENEQAKHHSFSLGDGRPQVSFSVIRKDGSLDGFMYHNIENVALTSRRGTDYLSFDHRGKAVTLAGEHLKPLFQHLMGLRVMEIYEHSDGGMIEGEPCVMRVEVTMLR